MKKIRYKMERVSRYPWIFAAQVTTPQVGENLVLVKNLFSNKK